MSSALADDPNKNIVIYINDFYPEFKTAFTKLSEKLGRPLRGVMLIDAERKASGNYLPDKEGFFEEVVVDFSNDGALRKAIKHFEDELLLVSCDSEAGQLYFKRVIPHVPYINMPTESSIVFSTDKGKMRELLRAYDENISPKATVVGDVTPESITKVMQKLEFPLIIKPTNLVAAMLVNRVNNQGELKTALERSFTSLNEIYPRHRGLGNKTMVVEEFVEGNLYTTDAYVDATGKVYVLPFIRYQNASMVGMDGYQIYQEETYHALRDDELQEGIETAKKAVHAVGLRSSVAHIELFHTTNGWKIVELGARPGGWRQEMYEVSYGMDHALNELLVKVGVEPTISWNIKTYSGLFQIYASTSGIVKALDGVEEARKHPRMYSLRVDVKPGDKVMPVMYGGEVLVEGLMHNTDPKQLSLDIAAVRASILVDIEQTNMDES